MIEEQAPVEQIPAEAVDEEPVAETATTVTSPICSVVPCGAQEQMGANGAMFKTYLFQVVTEGGQPLMEPTPAGDVPVLIASVPIPTGVRRLLRTAPNGLLDMKRR